MKCVAPACGPFPHDDVFPCVYPFSRSYLGGLPSLSLGSSSLCMLFIYPFAGLYILAVCFPVDWLFLSLSVPGIFEYCVSCHLSLVPPTLHAPPRLLSADSFVSSACITNEVDGWTVLSLVAYPGGGGFF